MGSICNIDQNFKSVQVSLASKEHNVDTKYPSALQIKPRTEFIKTWVSSPKPPLSSYNVHVWTGLDQSWSTLTFAFRNFDVEAEV